MNSPQRRPPQPARHIAGAVRRLRSFTDSKRVGAVSQSSVSEAGRATLLGRRRFQLASALALAAVLPWCVRGFSHSGELLGSASLDTLAANLVAICLTLWIRLSVETYPGIRSAYVILPSGLTAHGLALAWFVFTRMPYDRIALAAGFAIHMMWLYSIFFSAELRQPRRFAVVPFGRVDTLEEIVGVRWLVLSRARLHDVKACHAIVADFSADLPDEWQEFLAEAALAGRIVYQVKQLSESLTGRVELEHLSENSFGSLVPAQGYFYLKALADRCAALLALPLLLPVLGAIAIAIRIDSKGPTLFRQKRVGYAGKCFTVYKFRTMRAATVEDERKAAMTGDNDERVTRIGRALRTLRIDELPQVFNILKGEMSWIGPRPEAEVLSNWYTREIPFYRYRHVVKPGISGWAQVNQGHVSEVDAVFRKLQYDFYYIKYFSPWLDLLILIRTIKTMVSGFGAR